MESEYPYYGGKTLQLMIQNINEIRLFWPSKSFWTNQISVAQLKKQDIR